MDVISLGELRASFRTGGLRTAGGPAGGGLFFVTVQPRSGEWMVLVTTRGKQPRGFRDPGKAILLLHEIGVRKIVVDISAWEPGRAAEEGWRRPDVSVRQRRVYGVAAQLAAFRAEAGVAEAEADDPAAG
jgi:hypothetical protein